MARDNLKGNKNFNGHTEYNDEYIKKQALN